MTEKDDAWDAAQEGAERLQDGDVDGAIAELIRLAQEQPGNEYAHFFLGSAYFEQKDYTKAMRAYLTALQLQPEYVGAMIHMGQTLRMLGRNNEAIRMANQVLTRSEEDQDALFLLGTCHFARGDNAAAKGYLERYLETNPEIETAIEVEGMLQILRGEIAPAQPGEGGADGADGELN